MTADLIKRHPRPMERFMLLGINFCVVQHDFDATLIV